MFKFLRLGRRAAPQPVIETQRETFERLVQELNGAIDALPDKPAVTVDPASGNISFNLPEQFPDEALALPAPETDADHTQSPEPEGKQTKSPEPGEADPSGASTTDAADEQPVETGPKGAVGDSAEKLDGKAA